MWLHHLRGSTTPGLGDQSTSLCSFKQMCITKGTYGDLVPQSSIRSVFKLDLLGLPGKQALFAWLRSPSPTRKSTPCTSPFAIHDHFKYQEFFKCYQSNVLANCYNSPPFLRVICQILQNYTMIDLQLASCMIKHYN
uniref:Uncharacterized protein LOC104235419 n=1 Tax=Nicotiana sylvestris TaxID=4096 RepID=A0A1U7XKK6_NICSY|nr:PREDICTED: uncharacterized protein LOC104235419 [Nicotiana sylvestris]